MRPSVILSGSRAANSRRGRGNVPVVLMSTGLSAIRQDRSRRRVCASRPDANIEIPAAHNQNRATQPGVLTSPIKADLISVSSETSALMEIAGRRRPCAAAARRCIPAAIEKDEPHAVLGQSLADSRSIPPLAPITSMARCSLPLTRLCSDVCGYNPGQCAEYMAIIAISGAIFYQSVNHPIWMWMRLVTSASNVTQNAARAHSLGRCAAVRRAASADPAVEKRLASHAFAGSADAARQGRSADLPS